MHRQVFSFESTGRKHPGHVRRINEDDFVDRPESGLWLVADGMGGHDTGDVASNRVRDAMLTVGVPASPADLYARFEDRLYQAHEHIVAHAEAMGVDMMGTTVAALLIFARSFRCAWMGDSRVYRLRDNQLEQLTSDHSELRKMLEDGQVSEAEAQATARQNVITRAVTNVRDPLDIELVDGDVQSGDMFLLCSDGLNKHVSDAEIAKMLRLRPHAACDGLVQQALARGGSDNIAVVAVRCRGAHQP